MVDGDFYRASILQHFYLPLAHFSHRIPFLFLDRKTRCEFYEFMKRIVRYRMIFEYSFNSIYFMMQTVIKVKKKNYRNMKITC